MSIELKPCPFCGSSAEYFQSDFRVVGHGETEDTVGVRCTGCEIKYEIADYANNHVTERKFKSRNRWNERYK